MSSNVLKAWCCVCAAFLVAAMSAGQGAFAQGANKPGIVSNIKVLSNHCEDVSSPEDWKKTYIKDGMSDQDKAIAIWKTVVRYRHQDNPPNEGTGSECNVHDPIKTFNVYGYGMCCCASSNIEGLARFIGLQARGRAIYEHSVPEVFYDKTWHLFDASLMCYFTNPNGSIASVDEIRDSIKTWEKAHPDVKGEAKFKVFSKNDGWKNGPPLLATNKYYDKNGINPAGYHGWWSNIQEYADYEPGKSNCDYAPSMGYRVNVQLREGEKITRNWFNDGHFLDEKNAKKAPAALLQNKMATLLKLQREWGECAPGRIGTGSIEYDVPFAAGAFRGGALLAENLTPGDATGTFVQDAGKPATLVIRMPSSFVYLDGEVTGKAAVGQGGNIAIALSDNHGLTWKDVTKIDRSGEVKVNIGELIHRRYDYMLKFTMKGAGTGINSLKIADEIQHSQAVLPTILAGDNKITFSAGAQEGTVTVEPQLEKENKGVGKQGLKDVMMLSNYDPVVNGLGDRLAGTGDVTFTIPTPGDIVRLRMSFCWHAQNGKDGYDIQTSYDGGKTYTSVQKLEGVAGSATSGYFTVANVPAGKREVKVKISALQKGMISDLRLDVDYKEPGGGFRPVKVTFYWEEGGAKKTSEHIVRQENDTWTIQCGAGTVPKTYTVELAD